MGCDGSAKKLKSNELDKICALLNDTTYGTKILYCENSKASSILSSFFKNGVKLTSDSPDYDKERLILSSNPALDSIKIAKERHFANHLVGNVFSSDLKKLVPTYKNGESSYLILDRYPTNTQSFMAIVQADPLWGSKTQCRKLLQMVYQLVCLYSGDKRLSNLSCPPLGCQFFFGHHKSF